MPFCGNKGYSSGYRYAPVYAYPQLAPAYAYAPKARQHVHSWNRVTTQAAAAAPVQQTDTAAEKLAPAAR